MKCDTNELGIKQANKLMERLRKFGARFDYTFFDVGEWDSRYTHEHTIYIYLFEKDIVIDKVIPYLKKKGYDFNFDRNQHGSPVLAVHIRVESPKEEGVVVGTLH